MTEDRNQSSGGYGGGDPGRFTRDTSKEPSESADEETPTESAEAPDEESPDEE